eukprot:maker-scaffold_10-snap-gene-11.1-mRNA-1 protein AED:0.00 eAED:0.00 QI:6/1/1/1/1/1/2/593/76
MLKKLHPLKNIRKSSSLLSLSSEVLKFENHDWKEEEMLERMHPIRMEIIKNFLGDKLHLDMNSFEPLTNEFRCLDI